MVDHFAFGHFALGQSDWRGERNIAVDRIVAKTLALEVFHGNCTVLVRWLVGDGLSGIIVLRGRPADQALELAAAVR